MCVRNAQRVIDLRRPIADNLNNRAEQLKRMENMIRTLGPESAFKRGFSITTDETGKVLRSVVEADQGKRLLTRFKDGVVETTVEGD